ncbi:hypothetical protein [Lentilitoribacter sp. EG35]|uniref:hypothetical protein n=1 Tax=Lentilitoribacter sp. EG35 TaxID=3234192 RepID=UPI0034614CF2
MNSNLTSREFGPEFHKARRNLTLTGAVLFVWEIAGLELQSAASLPLTGISVTIRNPEVVPGMLACLAMFFAARMLIEWKQSDFDRRTNIFSRADLILAFAIAAGGILVFVYQNITQTDVAILFLEDYRGVSGVIIVSVVFYLVGWGLGANLADQMHGNRDNALIVIVPFYLLLCCLPILQIRKQYLDDSISPILVLLILVPFLVSIFAIHIGYQREKKRLIDVY